MRILGLQRLKMEPKRLELCVIIAGNPYVQEEVMTKTGIKKSSAKDIIIDDEIFPTILDQF
jgi:hypothetical protein